ncbi:PilT/PilU family type 4a pilus ATPase [Gallaecimonas kandeliae]|uniref:PilT/PilU family type 4a pilus ATPase n=1 Tax=Gallaecimonas kandeliae TaxID=3029055 RepID=UPI0026472DE5|nr:PilT/PilU family type 4a pilus ATPase [Gallaecimonas kandeliae]WKE66180.1 PilT/PilU family type 4a pilus ATPase [Gallaecimonas kandeliae]
MDMKSLLQRVCELNASDLFITSGLPPCVKVNGEIRPVADQRLTAAEAKAMVESVMNEKQLAQYHEHKDANFAIAAKGIGRFRVSAFVQRDADGMVLRRIQTQIPTIEELGLPPILKDIVMTKRGLVLMVGATGTGKSTSLAAMIGYRNENSRGHIVTIEDPIEFVHEHKRSIITQREVGIDCDSFDVALKNSLRQAPDVILLGEIRSQETMEFALAFAETGHLCMATLHANNANQALERVLHLVPKEKHDQFLFDMSLNLKAVVAQQLIPKRDGTGRVVATEVLLHSPLVSEQIRKGDIHLLKDTMERSRELGMMTFDRSLFELYAHGDITYADALHYADSPNDLRLMIKLSQNETGKTTSLDNVTIDKR